MSSHNSRLHDYGLILITIFVACVLSIMPLPLGIAEYRPEWLAMVVFYWAAFQSDRFGITAAWLTGLLLDVMDGTFLGMQALSLTAIAYVALLLKNRMQQYPLSYQSVIVFLAIGLHLTAVHWLQGLFSVVSSGYSYLVPALSSGLLWSLLVFILMGVQRTFR